MSLPIASIPLFAGASLFLLWQSRQPLRHPGSHGWWRFFAWEAILVVIVLNRNLRGGQVISQTLLILSLLLLAAGVHGLFRRGKASAQRQDGSLYGWEKTTTLVTTGIYRWLRHPMYASLLLLNWGMYFRAVGGLVLLPATLASYFLWRTALADEQECLRYFGADYQSYMQYSYRFIPGLL